MYLHVEHRKKDFRKTWKLEASSKSFSLGHSRHADIRLDKDHPGIAGVLEFKNGNWNFTHLQAPSESQGVRHIVIQGPTTIPVRNGEIHVSPFNREVHLFDTNNSKVANLNGTPSIWLIWKRNQKIWYSQYVETEKNLVWPHNGKSLKLAPTAAWQNLEDEGICLSYKLATPPDSKGLFSGAMKGVFDPTLRKYLIAASVACLLTGSLTLIGKKRSDDSLLQAKKQALSESTLVQLDKKPVQPPQAPKNAVAKALAQMNIPKSESSPKPSARRTLGSVFSQIGKHSLKSIAIGNGPKTLAITSTTTPDVVPSSAKTFKVLGSLGGGTGLHPSQFTKGLVKEGGVGAGNGPIGGSNLGQISQGNVGQGDIGLLHKESQVSGGLDRDLIAKYIQAQKGKILYCYERQLSANPGLFGKVSVKFQIAPNGTVESSNVTETTLANASVESCLLNLIGQWQFPKPEGGVRVLVSYPFVFKSLN